MFIGNNKISLVKIFNQNIITWKFKIKITMKYETSITYDRNHNSNNSINKIIFLANFNTSRKC